MSNEIKVSYYKNDSNIYIIIRKYSNLETYNFDTSSYEIYDQSNRSDYAYFLDFESANTYSKDFPTLSKGRYLIYAYEASNPSSLTDDDYYLGQTIIIWDGFQEIKEGQLPYDGLDVIDTTVNGVASTFKEMVVQLWRRFFRKVSSGDEGIITYNDDGSENTQQDTIIEGTTKTVGDASLYLDNPSDPSSS